MTNTAKIIIAAIAGATAGLVAGILLAPDNGVETRRKVSDTARKTVGKLRDFTDTSLAAASGLKERLFTKMDGKYEESGSESRMM